MGRGRLFVVMVSLSACLTADVCLYAAAPSAPAETPALSRSLRVVMDDNYPPYVFLDGKGTLQGILIDRWRLWERKTGIRVEIHAMDWGEALRRMEAGEFDVIDTIFRNEPRERVFDFSKPYAKLEVPVFFHENISGITDASSLKGFPVAVKSGDAAIEFLRKRGADQLLQYDSYEEIVRAARDHKIGVFVVDKPPAMYFLYKMGIQGQFRVSAPLYIGEFHRAVRKGNRALLAKVEEGFARISPEELKEIDRKWSGSATFSLGSLKYLLFAVFAALAAILVLALWNRTLRKSVALKTAELKKEMEITAAQAEKLRASEENYRLVVENAADGILIAQDGRIIFSNPDVSKFLGIPKSEIVGRSFGDLIHPEDRGRVAEYHMKRMRGEDAPALYEFRVLLPSGEPRWIQNKVVFTTWEGKRASLSFMRDITLQRKLEERLVQSRKMEAIGRLAGGIAHDFNNLLSVVIGYSHLLLSRPGSGAPYSKEVAEIYKAAERAAELTRQLLAFSRKQFLQPKIVCLNDIISGMTGSLRQLIREEIELTSRLEGDLPPVWVDPGQVEQVILNLAVNARDAMPHGGELVIGTQAVDLSESFAREHPPLQPGGHVVLFVSDTGAGMEKGILQRIFEPFFTTKGPGKGSGLGLATVEGIVSQSSGHVSVESEPGLGTTFKIFLPEAKGTPSRSGEAARGNAAGREVTILVVEDDPGVRELVVAVLVLHGYTVLAARDAEEAIRVSREHPEPIRMLVTDIMMPGMSGRALAEELGRGRPGIKVLYMSGYTADTLGDQGILSEGMELIEKPFTPAELAGRVRKILGA